MNAIAITKVVDRGEGYEINESMWIPKVGHEGNPFFQAVTEWLAAGNTPEPDPTSDLEAEAATQAELERIDRQSIRALRAILTGRGGAADTKALEDLEDAATAARAAINTFRDRRNGQ